MKYIFILLFFALLVSPVIALNVYDIRAEKLSPGGQGSVIVSVENPDNEDIEDVLVSLDLSNTPFTTVGSSSLSLDEIEGDEEEDFYFLLKADSDAEVGDYNIPYVLEYDDVEKQGTLGVSIVSESVIDFTSSLDNPIIGEKSTLSLKIINKGLSEVKFVNVKIYPDGFNLLSDELVYIGNIDSDDFESADFDIIINKKTPNVIATVEYQDLENKVISKEVFLPLNVYTQEQAIELGLKEKSKAGVYFGIVIALIVIYIVYRMIKRMRKKKSIKHGE